MGAGAIGMAQEGIGTLGGLATGAADSAMGAIFGIMNMMMQLQIYNETKQRAVRTNMVAANALGVPELFNLQYAEPMSFEERQKIGDELGTSWIGPSSSGLPEQRPEYS